MVASPAFLDAVSCRQSGVTARYSTLDATRMGKAVASSLVSDRISHEVECDRTFLKDAPPMGVAVVNNPFS